MWISTFHTDAESAHKGGSSGPSRATEVALPQQKPVEKKLASAPSGQKTAPPPQPARARKPARKDAAPPPSADRKASALKATNAGASGAAAAPGRDAIPHARGRIYGSVLEAVGGTPIVLLPKIAAAEGLQARIGLKLEYLNPLGSVKDRIGLSMIAEAEATGAIAPGRSTIIEPTSGNTGIALAFAAAAKGYRLIVVMPDGASVERQKMMRLLGAELELTPARQGMAGAISRAQQIATKTRGAWMARQFENPANPAIHATTTAEEIWADTAGRIDLIIGGIGTGGTVTGIARALKPRRAGLRVLGVEPTESAVLSGDEPGPHRIQGIGAGFHPRTLDLAQLDGVRQVSERESLAAARRCAREEGLPIGISSGAVLHALIAEARALPPGALAVGIAASFAERYLSTELFEGL